MKRNSALITAVVTHSLTVNGGTLSRQRGGGFTIVELLIVIVVIAILAAVTIVGYNGITNKATESGIKTDLNTAAKQLSLYSTSNGGFPNSASDAKVTPKSGTSLRYYAAAADQFCLVMTKASVSYSITHDGIVSDGACFTNEVTTLAGSSTQGYADGSGGAAQFRNPVGLAVDGSGNVYVADYGNHRIRKISPAGVVTTFAGSGAAGSSDGTGLAAQFRNPNGLALDSAGTLYVADYGNNKIRKISPAGVVTTLAGSGTAGLVNGSGTAAQFNAPSNLAVDAANNVYVADWQNHAIRKITSTGTVSTLAGNGNPGYADGPGASALFFFPRGIAVNKSGEVLTTEIANGSARIRKINTSGVVSSVTTTGTNGYIDGPVATARFSFPTSLAIDSAGVMYVADWDNNRIRKITTDGVVSTVAGTGAAGYADGTGSSAQLNAPQGIAVDSSGSIYIGEYSGHRVRKIQ